MSSVVGTVLEMTVQDVSDTGYLLVRGTERAILPIESSEKKFDLNDDVEVFLYHDRGERLIATAILPEVVRGFYGWSEVVKQVPNLGVFVNIVAGVEVLVSLDDLPLYVPAWPDAGDKLYVTLTVDKKGRLLAVPGSEREVSDLFNIAEDVELNDPVGGHVIRTDREGAIVITDESQFRAFIHNTEREREPRLGEHVTGRVIEVKEDGTLNMSLLPLKHERMGTDAERILAYLAEAGGEIPFGDKSDPEDIRETFQMSKAAFKRALGKLMKERKIEQRDGKTYLKKED